MIHKKCGQCGKDFPAERNNARFCSMQCSHEWKKVYFAIPWQQRFWPRVNKTSACWEWTGALSLDGYGTVRVSRGKNVRAHRAAYLLEHGSIPEGMNILHKCDNPKCVKPEHLFAGTQADNVHDMISKGRQRLSGLRNHTCSSTNHYAEANKP